MSILERLLAAALAMSVAACAATPPAGSSPMAADSSTRRAPADIALPIKGSLIVYMTSKDLTRQTRIPASSGNPEYWLQEGALLQRAAINAFEKLFEHVVPGTPGSAALPVATVEGSSGFNPMVGVYSARVIVTFSFNNAPIAKLEARSQAAGYEEGAFATALAAAFQDIRSQFLADEALANTVKAQAAAQPVAAEAPPNKAPPVPSPAPASPVNQAAATVSPVQPEREVARGTAASNPEESGSPAAAPAQAPGPAATAQEPARTAAGATPAQTAKPTEAIQKSARAVAPSAFALPIKGWLGISLAPPATDRQTYVNQGYSSYWFNEGKVIQAAAIRAFGKLFERVSPVEEGDPRYPMVKVDGGVDYNPIMGTCHAKVVADFFTGRGDPIARLSARSSAEGRGEAGFEKAYDAAFRDIHRQFLENGALGAALAEAAVRTSPSEGAAAPEPSTTRIAIPSTDDLIVYMAPEDLSKHTVVAAGLGYAGYWVAEGKIVQAAAIRAFARIFRRVSPDAPGTEPHPVLVVRGSGSFNPVMKTYSAAVNVTFLAPGGARIGKFEGKASVDETSQGEIGFQRAYEAAFQVIVDQLVAAGRV